MSNFGSGMPNIKLPTGGGSPTRVVSLVALVGVLIVISTFAVSSCSARVGRARRSLQEPRVCFLGISVQWFECLIRIPLPHSTA